MRRPPAGVRPSGPGRVLRTRRAHPGEPRAIGRVRRRSAFRNHPWRRPACDVAGPGTPAARHARPGPSRRRRARRAGRRGTGAPRLRSRKACRPGHSRAGATCRCPRLWAGPGAAHPAATPLPEVWNGAAPGHRIVHPPESSGRIMTRRVMRSARCTGLSREQAAHREFSSSARATSPGRARPSPREGALPVVPGGDAAPQGGAARPNAEAASARSAAVAGGAGGLPDGSGRRARRRRVWRAVRPGSCGCVPGPPRSAAARRALWMSGLADAGPPPGVRRGGSAGGGF